MKRYFFLNVLITFLLLNSSQYELFAQTKISQLQEKTNQWKNSPTLSNAGICFSVTDSQSGQTILQTEPQISLVPASIMKVVTTATALETLGPEYRFKTLLSYSGTIRNDTLFGDLQIIGGGDPTLGSMYFPETRNFQEEWLKVLQQNSIRVITGKLVVDASIYESQMIPGSWVWEDLGNYYGAGASGLTVYDNLYEIHLQSPETAGQPTQFMKNVPEIPGLELKNEVKSSDINSDQAYVFGSPDDSRRTIRGTIPKGKTDFVVKASMPNPTALLASEFSQKIKSSGIQFSGEAAFEKATTDGIVLTETLSPPLREIIRETNYESINLFAEHLLKHLAWLKTGLGGTREGCKQIAQFWKEKGMDTNGFFMNDGSGLSRFNAFTARHLVFILNYMKNQSPYAADFYQSLPAAGQGTLVAFNKEQLPGETVKAKSGSMTRVRCYAGYLKTTSGKELTFTVMLNNFSCSQSEATRKIQELLVMLRNM
ncbi:MAG: D-alanyl-D-alanine carboxypeptidase/D-alanyl-D-alanine-endopeptidase [Prolixibacteraceae bacterium]|nr:D-alanyl-D-alanine carboxypeptidase/D-alanyl-D-alanine-endopeptidase [Prolixibacteraceae bacterium]